MYPMSDVRISGLSCLAQRTASVTAAQGAPQGLLVGRAHQQSLHQEAAKGSNC